VDEDNATNDIVLLMEYIDIMNVKKHVESFGSLQLDTVRHVIFQILSTLADLMDIDWYHGRLNVNNIHIDDKFNVIITDYCLMSVIDQETGFTTDEGSRFDIFALGICMLKMLGKISIDQGSDRNIDYYLENMEALKTSYRTVSHALYSIFLIKRFSNYYPNH
jgi:serine/threonine protein kinase